MLLCHDGVNMDYIYGPLYQQSDKLKQVLVM